jgi:REP-associated tyrosine transposase
VTKIPQWVLASSEPYRDRMARIPRNELPEYAVFHVTARGAGRIPIYRADDDRRAFLALLAEAVSRFDWSCHAFCLMTNHYHLVVESFRQTLSAGMHRLNGIYAQSFNMKYDRWGHLFGERFWCRALEEDDLAVVCGYVLDNPVRAGICERIDEWPWSASRYDPDEL